MNVKLIKTLSGLIPYEPTTEANMKDIISIIKSKNPEDVTDKELSELQLLIAESMENVNKLQALYRSLTGKNYVPFL